MSEIDIYRLFILIQSKFSLSDRVIEVFAKITNLILKFGRSIEELNIAYKTISKKAEVFFTPKAHVR